MRILYAKFKAIRKSNVKRLQIFDWNVVICSHAYVCNEKVAENSF